MATTPWKPASILDVPKEYRKNGYQLRWIRKDNLEKSLLEGWRVVSAPSRKEAQSTSPQKTLIDGTPMDTTVQKRNLILCEMPIEMVESRKDFFAKLTDDALESSVSKYKEETYDSRHGQRAYGKVEIKTDK